MLGIPVSALPAAGLFTVKADGAAWLTGGDFDLEGSIVTLILGIVIALPMLIGAARKPPRFVSRYLDGKLELE